MKTCTRCKKEKSISDFGPRRGRPHGAIYCRKCQVEQSTQWQAARPGWTTQNNRKQALRRAGWTIETWEAAWEKQNGLCAICTRPMVKTGRKENAVSSDHCHTTGMARSLLCNTCNLWLGRVEAQPDVFEAFVRNYRAYLKLHGHPFLAIDAETP